MNGDVNVTIRSMRLNAFLLLSCLTAATCAAQDTPLTSLPYTPSLDTQFMDRSADPCADFYRYACGNWNKLNPMPPDQERWNVYGKLATENLRFLWGILDQASHAQAARTPNEQKIGDLFGSCMNEAAVNQAGADPLKPALGRIAGIQSITDLPAYIAEEHRNGIDGGVLFGFGSGQDFDNSSQVIAFTSAGGLGLPDRDYYVKSDPKSQEIRSRYVQHVQQMLQMIGESGPDAQTDSQTVMRIETELAKVSLTRVEKRDPYNLKHKMSREEFDRTTPAFDWEAYFQNLGAPDFHDVDVTEPKFFAEMNTLLNQEKPAAWRAYFRWHLVNSHAPYLASNFEHANFDFFRKYLAGVPQMQPRWKKCTRLVDSELGEALGQVFIEKTFSPETKQSVALMTRQIEEQMRSEIQSLPWMTAATKQRALEKLHSVVNKIGYPDHWRDYSSVTIASDFVGNVRSASSFEIRRDLAKVGKPLDRSEWGMTPPTVNAYYNPQMNDINFPAGVLQPPLYDPKLDAAPNYGQTGATIGHELTHGFDDEGRKFDAQGNLKDWWTADDAKAFEQRVQCVRDQYAQYTIIDDIKINSKLSSGEDVADIGGTFLAYLAWKHATEGQNLKSADGLTPGQRFFVGMAQWACGDQRAESKRMDATLNPHSPEEFRINGVVADLPEFGHAFSCRPGQPMMRVNACRVW